MLFLSLCPMFFFSACLFLHPFNHSMYRWRQMTPFLDLAQSSVQCKWRRSLLTVINIKWTYLSHLMSRSMHVIFILSLSLSLLLRSIAKRVDELSFFLGENVTTCSMKYFFSRSFYKHSCELIQLHQLMLLLPEVTRRFVGLTPFSLPVICQMARRKMKRWIYR